VEALAGFSASAGTKKAAKSFFSFALPKQENILLPAFHSLL
jgi:hypothetical protein